LIPKRTSRLAPTSLGPTEQIVAASERVSRAPLERRSGNLTNKRVAVVPSGLFERHPGPGITGAESHQYRDGFLPDVGTGVRADDAAEDGDHIGDAELGGPATFTGQPVQRHRPHGSDRIVERGEEGRG
jgi:hypothetical protein